MRDTTAGVFTGGNDETPLLEIQFAGSTTPTLKHRRDFLTGSVVDRAVQQAAEAACDAEERGTEDPGITAAMLVHAITDQVQAVAGAVTPANVGEFVDLPDGLRVTNVRRIEQPLLSAHDIIGVNPGRE